MREFRTPWCPEVRNYGGLKQQVIVDGAGSRVVSIGGECPANGELAGAIAKAVNRTELLHELCRQLGPGGGRHAACPCCEADWNKEACTTECTLSALRRTM